LSVDPAFLKRAFDAIDRHDPEAVEGLRGPRVAAHVGAVLATWRASLPWPVKDLYVLLLMDQRDARLEPLMRDALDAPAVETRSAAICYLTAGHATYERFLAAGGWVDPALVDAAIARWRNEVGATSKRECVACGAPFRENELACRYCGAHLRPEAEDRGVFTAGDEQYEARVGAPASSGGPSDLRVQHVLKPGAVGVRLNARVRAFREGSLAVVVSKQAGPAMVDVATRTVAVTDGSRVAYTTIELAEPGEYEVAWVAGGHRLAKVPFRIVP